MEKPSLEVIESHSADAFNRLRAEWDALLESCNSATVYQTWEWNEAWWRVNRRGKRLRLLQIRERSKLIGIAPFYVSRHLGTPLRRLAFVGNGASDYMDVIAHDDRAAEVCAAVFRVLELSRHFDLADLQQLRPHAVLRRQAEALSVRQAEIRAQEPCPFVALPDTWEEYTKRLGKKMRSNISYYDRLLPKTFETVETRLATADELDEALDALFDLHQKRWNAVLLPGVLGGSRTQVFHRLAARRLMDRGWLRLHITRVDGRIVAALYCFRYRESTLYYLGGFAPELAKYSLGTVLTAHAIRHAISEGCAEFDFLRGDEPYKQRWLPESRVNARLLVPHQRSVRSHAMLRLNRLENYLEHRAKAFAARQQTRGKRNAGSKA
jgi:CelD/BcsL family acetyltransferase involved in cellulose biosynthesis